MVSREDVPPPPALRGRPAALVRQVAGRLCLDFANLTGGWNDIAEARDDRLTDYVDLVAWAWKADLLDEKGALRLVREARQRPGDAAAVLDRARRLRGAVHAMAWTFERGQPQRPADLDVLATEARLARARQTLVVEAGRLAWRLESDARALDSPLWAVALSAEAYFTGGDLTRLHSCPGEDCGWHFEDTTRNRSRQWCDMGDCGNVAKVRRFRSKRRSGRTGGR